MAIYGHDGRIWPCTVVNERGHSTWELVTTKVHNLEATVVDQATSMKEKDERIRELEARNGEC